jgi:hypothetical protein
LSPIADAQLFPTLLRTNSWAPFLQLLCPNFYRTLWTIKVDFLVTKLGAVALNYLYIQEIDHWSCWLLCVILTSTFALQIIFVLVILHSLFSFLYNIIFSKFFCSRVNLAFSIKILKTSL